MLFGQVHIHLMPCSFMIGQQLVHNYVLLIVAMMLTFHV